LARVQREGVDYEADLMFDLTTPDNRATVSKTRCDRISPGEVFDKPGREVAFRLAAWVLDANLPRTLDDAIAAAIEKGVEAAAKGELGRPAYAAARDDLAAFCRVSDLGPGGPLEAALSRFKNGWRRG
jgi:hypothetical protein